MTRLFTLLLVAFAVCSVGCAARCCHDVPSCYYPKSNQERDSLTARIKNVLS